VGVETVHIPQDLSDIAAREDGADVRDWVATLRTIVSDVAQLPGCILGHPTSLADSAPGSHQHGTQRVMSRC
jgi:hypothetical protein